MIKALKWLRAMSSEERSDFRTGLIKNEKYAQTKEGKFTIGFFDHAEKRKFSQIEKVKLWRQVFPQEEYNDQLFRRRTSNVRQAIENFWIEREKKKDLPELEQSLLVLRELKRIGEQKEFRSRYSKQLKSFDPGKVGHHGDYATWIEFLEIVQGFLIEQHVRGKPEQEEIRIYEMRRKLIEEAFLVDQLKTKCADRNRSWLGIELQGEFFPQALILHVQQTRDPLPVLLQLYIPLSRISEEGNPAELREYWDLYVEFRDQIHGEEREQILVYLIDIVIRIYYKRADMEVAQILWELYQLEEHALSFQNERGTLSVQHFKNMISVALYLGNTDAAKKILDHYQDSLQSNQEEQEWFRFSTARLLFSRGKYRQAYSLLEKTSRHKMLNVECRILQLKCQIEMGIEGDEEHWSKGMQELDNFQTWVRRSHLTEAEKKLQRPRISILKKMFGVHSLDKAGFDQLVANINQQSPHDRPWLLATIEKIKATVGR